MRSADAATIRAGVPSAVLMENAGTALVEALRVRYPDWNRVVVVCGPGNNGGDGLVCARLLAYAGVRPTVFTLGDPSAYRGDPAENLERARAIGISPSAARRHRRPPRARPRPRRRRRRGRRSLRNGPEPSAQGRCGPRGRRGQRGRPADRRGRRAFRAVVGCRRGAGPDGARRADGRLRGAEAVSPARSGERSLRAPRRRRHRNPSKDARGTGGALLARGGVRRRHPAAGTSARVAQGRLRAPRGRSRARAEKPGRPSWPLAERCAPAPDSSRSSVRSRWRPSTRRPFPRR